MLRRRTAALFEAPAGARIEVVAESQNNNGVNDARFEYAGRELDRELILGLPGCHFNVEGSRERLKAVVGFDGNAAGTARYDLSEVENGVLRNLGKFTLKSDNSPTIDFSIDPVAILVPVGAGRRGARPKRATAGRRKAARKRAVAKKRSAKPARRGAKKTARKAARKASRPTRKTPKRSKQRSSSRKRR